MPVRWRIDGSDARGCGHVSDKEERHARSQHGIKKD
jgi:hypothetical protein